MLVNLLLVGTAFTTPLQNLAGKLLPDQYIVVFKPDIQPATRTKIINPSQKSL